MFVGYTYTFASVIVNKYSSFTKGEFNELYDKTTILIEIKARVIVLLVCLKVDCICAKIIVNTKTSSKMLNLASLTDTTNYEIYLVNKGATAQNFWCFLEKPEGVSSSEVYANSSAMLSVLPNYQGINKFTIPLQYMLAAGASNEAVGLNVQIDSAIMKNASLTQTWEAKYATAPPPQGPTLQLDQGVSSPGGTLAIKSNDFNQVQNENNSWFSNMSFGIQTAQGFVGVTWKPGPNQTSTITPKFSFYIATGSYTSNSLADMATISSTSAAVSLSDFQNLKATVTLDSTGKWYVTPGKPSMS